ncbi:MAG: tRNA (adenosine(37)-N6)-threonylcarbamoyltransferase complex dimerization subunit type 1 TsaB [Pseudohongiella sp.]|uniref:tRNA (adenosine(37)-N6)-threonylcarbamoyltransferase complex dimerization subunit type 1 TsaB n=1 Tax=Pseudohongiella sp. TaxID=1979412 RepID=UPI0034A0406F
MTALLAIDTAADICSVAVHHGRRKLQLKSPASRRHAAEVLPMVQSLLDESGLTLAELGAIVMVSGPGSFTGLRIGTAVAQGLSFGANIPIIRISSLAMQARTALRSSTQQSTAANMYFVCLHAREDEFYFACYLDDGLSSPRILLEDQVCDAATVLRSLAAAKYGERVGNAECYRAGSGWLHPLLQQVEESDSFPVPLIAQLDSDANILCELGGHAFLEGRTEPVDGALPVYLKEDLAYRKS